MHGKDISIPKGTEITAYVNGDMRLDIAKFKPTEIAVNRSTESPGSQSAKVQLESTPSGADIEVDGSFVGNAPSDLQVTEGEHTILVRKTGFQDWKRKLRVNAGSRVHLNAELERITASDVTSNSSKETPTDVAQQDQGQTQDVVAGITETKVGAVSQVFTAASIGVRFDGNPDLRHDGVTLTALTPGGPADQAGIKAGDVILAINDHYLFTIRELQEEISHHEPGTKIAVRYRRYTSITEASVVVGQVQ